MSTHAYPRTGARVPAPAWRFWSLLVTALVIGSAGLLAARFVFDGDTFQNCRYLGPSTRMYVTSWAAPACGLAAALLLLALRRGAHRRGQRPGAVWQGRVAMVAVCLVPVLLLAQFAALYWVYEPDPSGGQDCSGLSATHGSSHRLHTQHAFPSRLTKI
ncbi:hypothetical protein [Streptomyces sp. NPDC046862]|uniref:hypothetical protein n=1 Tax=Streptomyces sp. NPDC046862 TaxID=3154603 RepID=UPI00345220E0